MKKKNMDDYMNSVTHDWFIEGAQETITRYAATHHLHVRG